MNRPFSRMLSLFEGRTRTWIVVGVLMLLQSFLATGITLLISRGIDLLTGDMTYSLIAQLAGAIFIMGIVQWWLGFLQKKIAKRSVIEILKDLQLKLFHALIRKNTSYFTKHPSGAIISRITGDTEAFGQFIQMFAAQAGVMMSIAVLLTALFIINSYLALWVCALLPIIIGAALLFRKLSRNVSNRMYEMFAELNANIKESLAGMTVTKNFCQEEAMLGKFIPVNEKAYQANMAQGKVFSSILPLTNLLSSICVCTILYIGGTEVLNLQLSIGALYLFVETVQRIWDPVSSLANFSNQIQDGMAAAERMLAVLEDEDREEETFSAEEQDWNGGDIRFNEVGFSYGNDAMQLESFTLHIKKGDSIALVGHTGAGKTTIARILLRFHDIREGSVTVGGVDLHAIPKGVVRGQIGYIPQMPFLFSGSVKENIRYGCPDATDEDILKAAQIIHNGAWLNDLPDGLETQVGERGGNLSSGQRQLVTIVRILLKNPSLLILDEATANIDPFTEQYIKEALQLAMKGRTSIIIAHRLSTIREADKIVVLASGRKLEEGTHEQLIVQEGAYKNLYDMYYRHQQEENDDYLLEGMGKQ